MAQRTPLQAYQEIKAAFKAGTCNPGEMNGTCLYRKESKTSPIGFIHCGVGTLFNKAQLDDIRSKGLNNYDISDVSDKIGVKNIEEVTGLGMEELVTLQGIHDGNSYSRSTTRMADFEQYLDKKIAEHS